MAPKGRFIAAQAIECDVGQIGETQKATCELNGRIDDRSDRIGVVLLRFGRMRRKRGRFLGRFTWLVGLDLGHLLSNAAFSFQSVIGVLQPQEIAFGQTEKLA